MENLMLGWSWSSARTKLVLPAPEGAVTKKRCPRLLAWLDMVQNHSKSVTSAGRTRRGPASERSGHEVHEHCEPDRNAVMPSAVAFGMIFIQGSGPVPSFVRSAP